MRQASGSSRGTGSIRTPFRWRKKSKRVLVEIDGGDDCREKARCRAFDEVTQAGRREPPPGAEASVDADEAAGLVLPEARIEAAMGEQLGMRAAFGDVALVQHHQAVHARNGRQAVGDGDHRLSTIARKPCSAGPGPTAKDLRSTAFAALTDREYEVVEAVAEGLDNAEAAARLFMSEGTVRNHISAILAKLGLRNRTQVAVMYYRSAQTG